MAMLISGDTPYGKELWKWEHTDSETHPSDSNLRGMRPTHPQPYPAMLYRCTQQNPVRFDSQVVADEVQERLACGQGFVAGGQGEALKAFQNRQQANAVGAAERNWMDRNMSAKAKEESDAFEQAHSTHQPEIPRTPIKKRGRPSKVKNHLEVG